MPQAAGQVKPVSLGLPRGSVPDVGVQGVPTIGGLNQAVRAHYRAELACHTRAAVTIPFTTGQKWTHVVEVHLDTVAVSGANQ